MRVSCFGKQRRSGDAKVPLPWFSCETSNQRHVPKPQSSSITRQGICFLVIYLSVGVAIKSVNRERFSGIKTHHVIDALYFYIVTMCTIGYSDITPWIPVTKVFCLCLCVGEVWLHRHTAQWTCQLCPRFARAKKSRKFLARNYNVDVAKGRIRIRFKVGLALDVVLLCTGIGSLLVYFVEDLDWVD